MVFAAQAQGTVFSVLDKHGLHERTGTLAKITAGVKMGATHIVMSKLQQIHRPQRIRGRQFEDLKDKYADLHTVLAMILREMIGNLPGLQAPLPVFLIHVRMNEGARKYQDVSQFWHSCTERGQAGPQAFFVVVVLHLKPV